MSITKPREVFSLPNVHYARFWLKDSEKQVKYCCFWIIYLNLYSLFISIRKKAFNLTLPFSIEIY